MSDVKKVMILLESTLTFIKGRYMKWVQQLHVSPLLVVMSKLLEIKEIRILHEKFNTY